MSILVRQNIDGKDFIARDLGLWSRRPALKLFYFLWIVAEPVHPVGPEDIFCEQGHLLGDVARRVRGRCRASAACRYLRSSSRKRLITGSTSSSSRFSGSTASSSGSPNLCR